MKKFMGSFVASLFLTMSFGVLNASSIQDGVLVAANDKCGGDGACGSSKKIMEQKCSSERRTEFDKKKYGDKVIPKCGEEREQFFKDNKCGGEKKPVQKKCGSN